MIVDDAVWRRREFDVPEADLSRATRRRKTAFNPYDDQKYSGFAVHTDHGRLPDVL